MAEATVSEPSHTYTQDHAKTATKNVAQAIAIVRAVQVAADAVEDGSMKFEHGHVSRWEPAIAAATDRVALVRDVLLEEFKAPAIDWFTSLALLEAFDAALWHGKDMEDSSWMDAASVKDMCEAVVSELVKLKMGLAESL